MSLLLIVNPISGARGHRGDSARLRVAIAERVLAERKTAAEIVLTERARHAGELAAAAVARGVERVVVWGGDGTVNDAAGPMIGAPTALGIVPSGSGDGLARGLGLSRDPEIALRAAIAGTPRPIDVGWIGERHFLNVAGIGFDAAVAHAFNQRGRRGARAYFATGLPMVWTYQASHYDIQSDAVTVSGRQFMIAFANGPQYGNGIILCGTARFDDGWLDAVVLADGSPLQQFWRARRLNFRRQAPASGIVRARLTEATVSGEHLRCHADGETFDAAGTLRIRLQPQALRVVSRD
jgi:diacylglycerol kinase (ATP)